MTFDEMERITELEDRVEELEGHAGLIFNLQDRVDRLAGAVDGITEIGKVRLDALDAHVAALEETERNAAWCGVARTVPAITLADPYRRETAVCPVCGALLTMHETTDEGLRTLQPELAPMLDHAPRRSLAALKRIQLEHMRDNATFERQLELPLGPNVLPFRHKGEGGDGNERED